MFPQKFFDIEKMNLLRKL